jgi:hypothetical protein
MNKIVAIIHPFVIMQEVSVYKNDECIENLNCSLDDVEKAIYGYCKKYNINNIDIHGGQLYGLQIKDHFKTNKFENSDQIKINIC